MAKLEKWKIRHVRKIDKDCKGALKVLHFRPYQFPICAYLVYLTFLPVASICGPVGFKIFDHFFRPYRFSILPYVINFYHFIYLLFLPFSCVSTPGPVGVNIFPICAPLKVLPFYVFTDFTILED